MLPGDKPCTLRFEPPMSDAEIAERLGTALPTELIDMLKVCSGFKEYPGMEEFYVGPDAFGAEDIFPISQPIASDGTGNFWVLDLTGEPKDVAPVYFACHDAPVMVFMANSLTEFVELLLSKNVVDVSEEWVTRIWRENPNILSHADALAGDDALRDFAGQLDETFLFIDLRNAAPGDGFSWGRYGAETVNIRYGVERIFAYQQRKLNWWQRIFGV